MNLYLLTQTVETGYGTYDSAVVAAENEEAARRIDPSGSYRWDDAMGCWVRKDTGKPQYDKHRSRYQEWPEKLDDIQVAFLGVAANNIAAGMICASYHDG